MYDAESNPGGVRCTLEDVMRNVFGPRPSAWTAPEQRTAAASPRPIDNIGIQWGVEGLESGRINRSSSST